MDIGWKIASAGAAAMATMLATKVVDSGWKAVTGHSAPHDPEEPEADYKEVLLFALISGAMIGLARVFATQQASKWYGGPEVNKAAEEARKAQEKRS